MRGPGSTSQHPRRFQYSSFLKFSACLKQKTTAVKFRHNVISDKSLIYFLLLENPLQQHLKQGLSVRHPSLPLRNQENVNPRPQALGTAALLCLSVPASFPSAVTTDEGCQPGLLPLSGVPADSTVGTMGDSHTHSKRRDTPAALARGPETQGLGQGAHVDRVL